MAQPLIQTSFTAGEIAPALWGQVDLRRYQTGAAVARNFWVDYRGGLFSRPGTALVATCLPNADEEPPCPLPFVFSQEQSYILELSDSVAYGKIMRIIYRGAVVRETGLAITAVVPDIAGAEFTITGSTAATWAAGERVYIEGVVGLDRDNGVSGVNGGTFIIASVAAVDKVKLLDVNGQDVTALDWTAYSSGGTAAREVWVTHPWDGDILRELKYAQSADIMTVTHQDYDIYLIKRLSHTSWQIVADTFGSTLAQPAGQAAAAVNNVGGDPQYFYPYVVTAYNTATREQSAPGSAYVSAVNSALNQSTQVINQITWTAASGADMYRIYKGQPVPNGYEGSPPYFWGLMGQTADVVFSDVNLEPDYTIGPPTNQDPFATNNPGCVSFYQQRRIFAASAALPSTFWMSHPGQYNNFDTSYPTQSDDAITGTVVAGEVNEITSLVSMSTGVVALTAGGAFLISGDGKKAPITPATANASTQTFAGAAPLQPLRVADNLVYLTSQKTAVRDLAYDFFTDVYKGTDLTVLSGHLFQGRDIVQWAWAPEPHKVVAAVRDDGILLTMTYLKDQEVVGWTRNDTNGQFVGVATIPEPGESALYVIVRRYVAGTGYRYFHERFVRRAFGQNVPMNIPSDPEQAWCVDAGARYPLTYPAGTLTSFGFTLGALTAPVVIDGGRGYDAGDFVQVLDPTGTGGEVSITVVAGVITAVTLVTEGLGYTNPQILVGGGSGAVISVSFQNLAYFQKTGTAFSGADVGKVLRVGGGRGEVTRYLAGPALLEVRMDRQVDGRVPNEPGLVLPPSPEGTWSLTTPVSFVGGLEHLEGGTVQIMADGSVVPPQAVVDGCIELPEPASAITIGQGYTCQFQSLRPPDPAIQSRRRSMSSVTLRVVDTRGVAIGNSFDDMVEIKQRDDENYGQHIAFQIGGGPLPPSYTDAPVGQNPIGYDDTITNVGGGWDTQGHVCILQSYPLPAQILATISEITVGDTPG